MKLSGVSLLILFCVAGAITFAVKTRQDHQDLNVPSIPSPSLKPTPLVSKPELRLQVYMPERAGSYGRLSVDDFLKKRSPDINIHADAPMNIVTEKPSAKTFSKPLQRQEHQAVLAQHPIIPLNNLQINTMEAANLPYIPEINEARLIDRVTNMAEASPIQPDSRGCGTLRTNLKAAPKHAKVRSVGMERQITDRTSIGVEYVYKDGCYKNAIAPFRSLDMPSDDGVNLRFNMKF